MDISTLALPEAIEAVNALDTKEALHEIANSLVPPVPYSGNTGIPTLKTNIIAALNDAEPAEVPEAPVETPPAPARPSVEDMLNAEPEEEIQIAVRPKASGHSIEEMLKMDPKTIEDPNLRRKVIRLKALKLVRVRITNLDPSDAALESGLFTVVNKYIGKASRVVPYDVDWHVEQILLNQIKNQQFALRKERKGGQIGVKQYDTKLVKKFSIEYLDDLTPAEKDALARSQEARQAIDHSN